MILTQRSGLIVGTLAKLIGWILNAIYNAFAGAGIENIAICIIILTVIVRLFMYPLSLKQTRSSKIQRFLQPEFNKINKKYRGKKDQDSLMAMNKETRELQEKYGIKMTAGCLTSFIQLPIIYALYAVIQDIPAYVGKVKELYVPVASIICKNKDNIDVFEKFVGPVKEGGYAITSANYKDQSDFVIGNSDKIIDYLCRFSQDNWDALAQTFNASGNTEVANIISGNVENIMKVNKFILGISMNEAPGWRLTWAMLIPILCLVFQWLSMKITPMQDAPGADPQQQQSQQMMKTMTNVMPLFSFFITVTVPAGVGLYWAVSAMISCLTMFLTNKYFDHADMEAIVKKEEEKAAKKNAKKKASGKKSFMDKLMEAAAGQDPNAQPADSHHMEKINSTNLKNYTPSESKTSAGSSEKKVYKPGSIAEKANLLQQYNEKGGKE